MWEQLLVNGIATGLLYGLIAHAVSLTHRLHGFFNFGYAAITTLSAYTAWSLIEYRNYPTFVAIVLATAAGVSLNLLLELGIFRLLRNWRASPSNLFLASLGIAVVAQNLVAMTATDEIQVLSRPPVAAIVAGALWSTPQQAIALVHIVLAGLLCVFLFVTAAGRQLRGLADNPSLGYVVGINVPGIHITVAFAAGLFASAAGILMAYDRGLTPSLGFDALLVGVVAAIAGGTSRWLGPTYGGVIVGLAQYAAQGIFPGSWSRTTISVILLVFLLCGPKRYFGPLTRQKVT